MIRRINIWAISYLDPPSTGQEKNSEIGITKQDGWWQRTKLRTQEKTLTDTLPKEKKEEKDSSASRISVDYPTKWLKISVQGRVN